MTADYHIHTKSSPDAKGTMEEYIEKAKKKNISEIGFSDHMLLHPTKTFPRMAVGSMPDYVKNFLKLKQTSAFPIKLGIEMDFVPDSITSIREFVRRYPFDYIIGSVHLIGEWEIDHPGNIDEYTKRDVMQIYEEYFGLVKELCRSEIFNILAHPDLIKVFGFRPNCDFSHLLTEAAEIMAKSNVCAEINTRGLRRPCREIYPSEQFLKILYKHDVSISFGSDAHEPGELGQYLEQAMRLAKKVGYSHACMFDRGEKEMVRIDRS